MRVVFESIKKVAIFSICVLLLGLHTGSAHALSVGDVGPFQATSSLPLGSSDSTSAVYNDYIYEVGGASSQYGSSLAVNFAHINQNGTLGAWTATTPLPNAVYDSATVVYNGYIYEVGGAANGGNGSSTTVYVAPLNNDGTVGEWNTTSSLPHQLVGHSAVVNDGFIYAIAGHDTTGGLSNKIYYAPININGSIGSWTIGATLPSYSFEGTAVVHNDSLYIMGGLGDSFDPSAEVYVANLNVDGSVGSIQISSNAMPAAVVEGSSVVNDGFIYVVGGGSNFSVEGDQIYYAPISNDGTVGVWQTASTPLPNAVRQSTSVTNNGYLYSIGGYNNGSQDFVNFAPFITSNTADSDEDSILDTEENAGPHNGDANNDGTPDGEQPNVASFLSFITNEYQVVETDCQGISSVQVGREASEPADSDYDYPMGLSSFHITCDEQGASARVRQYYYGVEGNDSYSVRKWKDDGSYAEIPGFGLLGLPTDDDVVFFVQYNLTDGSQFDDDGQANGVIIDPSGPALRVQSTPDTTAAVLAETGTNLYLLTSLSILLIGSSALMAKGSI